MTWLPFDDKRHKIIKQIAHQAQVCDTPGNSRAQWVWKCWCRSERRSPHTAGCQTAGWDWKETTSTCKNSRASWTQPAGAPTNQKHKCFTSTCSVTHIYFILQRLLFYPREMCQLSSAGMSACPQPCSTLLFCSLFFLTFPVTEGQDAQCQSTRTDTAVTEKLCLITHRETYIHTHRTVRINHTAVSRQMMCDVFLPVISVFRGDAAVSSTHSNFSSTSH